MIITRAITQTLSLTDSVAQNIHFDVFTDLLDLQDSINQNILVFSFTDQIFLSDQVFVVPYTIIIRQSIDLEQTVRRVYNYNFINILLLKQYLNPSFFGDTLVLSQTLTIDKANVFVDEIVFSDNVSLSRDLDQQMPDNLNLKSTFSYFIVKKGAKY